MATEEIENIEEEVKPNGEASEDVSNSQATDQADDRASDQASGQAEGSDEGGAEDSPSWSSDPDYADYISETPTSENKDVKQVPIEEYNELMEAANNWRELQRNDVALAVIGHLSSGGKVEDLVSQFDTKDYSKLSNDEIYSIGLRRDVPDITDEEIEEALEEFKDEPPYKQKMKVAAIRKELSSGSKKGGGDLVTAYNKNLERHEQVVSKFKSDFQGELDKWKNKGSFFDVEITDDVVKDLQQFVDERNGMILADKDGNVDAKAYFKAVFAMRYLHKVAEAKQNKGARKATENYMREHQNAGSNANRPAATDSPATDKRSVNINAKFREEFGKKRMARK